MKTTLMSNKTHWHNVGSSSSRCGLRFDEIAVLPKYAMVNDWIQAGFESADRKKRMDGDNRIGTRSILPVYVEESGVFWKFSAVAWERFLRVAIQACRAGETHPLPEANRLTGRPSCVGQSADGWFFRNTATVRFLQTGNWTLAEWHAEIEEVFGAQGATEFLKKTF